MTYRGSVHSPRDQLVTHRIEQHEQNRSQVGTDRTSLNEVSIQHL